MATARNDPCPCGSGKRYKHCHGAPGAAAQAAPGAAALQAIMNAALAHQQRNEYAQADHLYAQALAIEPRNFDALHMQGVVAYQLRKPHRAEALIRQALEVNPHVEAAQHNLQLVLAEHALEGQLCMAMLPALSPWCSAAPPKKASPLHLVSFPGAETPRSTAFRIALEASLSGAAGLHVWRQRDGGSLEQAEPADSPASAPGAGLFVFIGTALAPGPWYQEAEPEGVVVVCSDLAACGLYDQVRAATGQLARPVHLWYADGAMGDDGALPLPGSRGDAAALAAALTGVPASGAMPR